MMPSMLATQCKKIIIGTAASLLFGGLGCACKGTPVTATPAAVASEPHGDVAQPPQPPTAKQPEADATHGGVGGALLALPTSLAAFHEVLAPLWHAAESPQRTTDTCNAIGELTSRARAITIDPAPAGIDANTWGNAGINLQASVKALHAECGTAARSALQPTFAGVHQAFHALLELLPH